MPLDRTLRPNHPAPPPGRVWDAWALLEAPDEDGKPGEFTMIENGDDPQPGPRTTSHAQHDPGWYKLLLRDNGRSNIQTDPIRLSGAAAAGRVRFR